MPSETGFWNAEEAETNHDFSENLADWISFYLPKDKKIIDYGCGNGAYVKYLSECGFEITGVEGDINTVTQTDKFIQQDLSQHFEEDGFNSICFEVGEHLPAQYLKTFLDNLANNTKGTLILSWAIPGQEGYHHLSCRHNIWVINEMAKRKMNVNLKASLAIREVIEERLNYFKNTLLIFHNNES